MAQRQSNVHSPARRRRTERTQLTDLILHDKLETTHAKAKEISKKMDRLITLAKKGTLAARRQAARTLRNSRVDDKQTALQKLFGPIAKAYANRDGGYTKVLKTGNRKGDAAPTSIVLFTK
jgi:large subunit ribosomal protein L17